MFTIILIITFLSFIISLFYLKHHKNQSLLLKKLNKKTVVVTGGSLGIGKSIAEKCFENGANVVIIARNLENLNKAYDEIIKKKVYEEQKLIIKSSDVTSWEQLNKTFERIFDEIEEVNYLINCAGTSVAYTFEDTPVEKFESLMKINYLGAVNTTKIVLSKMKKQNSGNIVFVSSIAGLVGIFGFSAYSSSKFALVGLAQSLHMELKSQNINVMVSFPPDTDTPGFEEEQKTKPVETKLISDAGGLANPDDVAIGILKDSINGKFTSTIGFENNLVLIATSGMMPIISKFQIITEFFLIGFCRLIAVYFLCNCHNIINKIKNKKD